MLNKFKLGTKFTLLLSLVFIFGIVVSGIALSKALQHRAENEIISKGVVLMETMNSLRDYINTQISPLLAQSAEAQPEFIPETIPSFSVREVFEGLRQKGEYKDLFYKDATLNPTNLLDKTDNFEDKIVTRFRNEPETKEISGFRSLFGKQVFYKALPIAIEQESCLRCHSTPAAAPKNLIKTYGSKNGFGWQLNEIIGAQVIYVPAEQVFERANRSFFLIIGIFLGIFTFAVLIINYLLKQTVVQPVKLMAKLAQKITAGTTSDKVEEFDLESLKDVARRADELGQMGRVFESMAREIYAREQRLKQQLQELRIEIDEAKAARQVAEITESDYFQELQKKAKHLRKRSKESDT
ncbi:DUF3365 domain-containing protein [Coleofasciculus sp. FACHB-T130]|uniref:Tll0287-like domain-containing protein n=1 Tax=Cyanophyceae TaxID=3028117 RepID=UPI0016851507|nr:DUF3365 domain-containing protein [Coleofasciculus sp. FACHB-T130]MBD1881746.1 DUF3365 domain-containing protein [Coleofasciculus sp. FACHB-T130]